MALKLKGGADLSGQRAINAADGSSATDLVTLQQMQAAIRGLDWKDSVRAASTGNLNLAAPGATIDGVTMSAGDRFLAKDQTLGQANGIYVWNGAATPATRAVDADAAAEVTAGFATTVTEGTNKGTGSAQSNSIAWVLITNGAIVVGTTVLVFAQLGGGAAAYSAGTNGGILLTGQAFSVIAGNGIVVDATGVRVDTAVVTRKFTANCVATTNPQTFTHGLGTDDVTVAVWEGTEQVYPDITKGSGTVIINWGSAPTASQYRVVIHG